MRILGKRDRKVIENKELFAIRETADCVMYIYSYYSVRSVITDCNLQYVKN
jgi:hypothetical protein